MADRQVWIIIIPPNQGFTDRPRYDTRRSETYETSIGGSTIHHSYWSDTYQWLLSNVKFQEDGSVKFTSYINGIHPNKHPEIYETIEKLIVRALPAWDFCLARYRNHKIEGAGRTEPRFPQPDEPDDDVDENWSISYEEITNRTLQKRDEAEEDTGLDSDSDPPTSDEDDDSETESTDGRRYYGTRAAWYKLRKPVQPEAPEFEAWNYGVKPGESLRDHHKDIQVMVMIASIKLTPDKPTFPAGGWHVERQMNEYIVGTALYYRDSENVTPSHLHFRMQTDPYQNEDWNVGQNNFSWMERVYGTRLGNSSYGNDCIHQYGSVETKQGRLLAFPSVFHYRVLPVKPEDKTKSRHRHFIAL
ncbi:hypothetical protein FOBRF1_006537 [Fusarium oxysporum]